MNRVSKIKKLKSGFKFYKNSFGLHPPYLILCDSNFLYAAVDSRISLEDTFKTVFKGQIYLKVSKCALDELSQLKGPKFSETKKFAYEHCQRFVCNHQTKKPSQCIYLALRQGFNGCVCTQDQELRRKIHRDFPKTPVFFIANQSIVICPPPKSLKEKIRTELMVKYAPQALKKENAKPQDDIELETKDDDIKEKDEEEEEEEEFKEDQVENDLKKDKKAQKHEEIDVLQNFDEAEEEGDSKEKGKINENEEITKDVQIDEENIKTDKKRKHRHIKDAEQKVQQEFTEENKNEEIPKKDNLEEKTNDNIEPPKHRKKHHRSTNQEDDA